MLQQVYKVYRTFVCVFFLGFFFFNKHLHLYIKTQIMTKYVHANEIKKKEKKEKNYSTVTVTVFKGCSAQHYGFKLLSTRKMQNMKCRDQTSQD